MPRPQTTDLPQVLCSDTTVVNESQPVSNRAQQLFTPPASPYVASNYTARSKDNVDRSRRSSGTLSLSSSEPFDNCATGSIYFKAQHAYVPELPTTARGEKAVCLKLAQGAIIYIHSIHSSGWADGSLLSGERGWFPSNYCEPHTLVVLAPISQAIQLLVHLVFRNKLTDYVGAVSAIVVAVRELLLEANCLTRDSPLIRQNEHAKRERKLLLSELSGLVTTTKRQSLNLSEVGPELSVRSERISIRAGRFVHAIGAASGIYANEIAHISAVHATRTPPSSHDFSCYTRPDTPNEIEVLSNGESLSQDIDAFKALSSMDLVNGCDRLPCVSKLLDHAHDSLLSILFEFIGQLRLQVYTQAATPLLQATSHCVNAARALLATLESICAHYADRTLIATKDLLYRHITSLVTAARHLVDAQDGVVSNNQTLIETATGVVRGAGHCLLRAKYILEVKGDFGLAVTIDDSQGQALPRDVTCSTLASLGEDLGSDDTQAQVQILEIPYKTIPTLPLRAPIAQTSAVESDALGPLSPSVLSRRPVETSCSTPISPVDSEISESIASVWREEDLEVNLNHESQVIGATLASMIEAITPHDRTPDSNFANTFFLTFRLFVSPPRLAEMLISRFNWTIQQESEHDKSWIVQTAMPIRLRVYNIFKGWLDANWRPEHDECALPLIRQFADEVLLTTLPQAAQRLIELCTVAGCENYGNGARCRNMSTVSGALLPDSVMPSSIITRPQLLSLQSSQSSDTGSIPKRCSITDFDELEIARQLTIIDARMFCAITPVELVGQEFSKKGIASLAVNVKAMSAASTDLAGWIADTILSEVEQKRRSGVLKHWIKIAEHCAEIKNYNTLMAIMSALNSSTISRLKRTWEGLSRSQRNSVEHLRSITDHQKNYAMYRSKIRTATAPCLPFLGLYLTDLTFIDEGNPNHRLSRSSNRRLINFDKHARTSRVITDLQRFQVLYRLQEVPALSEWITTSCGRMRSQSADLSTTLWRRSLVIEPKFPAIMKREPSATSSIESEPKSERLHKMSFLASWSS